jgi:purine nucleosidase
MEAGPVKEGHAVLKLIERIRAAPGQITLLSLGRLTNIALALTLEPQLARWVSGIIVMGGRHSGAR